MESHWKPELQSQLDIFYNENDYIEFMTFVQFRTHCNKLKSQ
jgi:hypothetical protein